MYHHILLVGGPHDTVMDPFISTVDAQEFRRRLQVGIGGGGAQALARTECLAIMLGMRLGDGSLIIAWDLVAAECFLY